MFETQTPLGDRTDLDALCLAARMEPRLPGQAVLHADDRPVDIALHAGRRHRHGRSRRRRGRPDRLHIGEAMTPLSVHPGQPRSLLIMSSQR